MLAQVTKDASFELQRISARRSRNTVFVGLTSLSSVRLAARFELLSSASEIESSSDEPSISAPVSQSKVSRCFCLAWQMAAKVVIRDSVPGGNRHARSSSEGTAGVAWVVTCSIFAIVFEC
jgi:hypothetical protein